MLEGLALFGQAIWHFMTPATVAIAMGACLVGIVIGALPGLTATMGVALMTTLTLGLEASTALLILVCTYVGAIYGGSRSAILLNIPGTPASAASCLDGHALARQGMAGQAMGIATSGSVMGTWIGMLFLALLTPILGEAALSFGSYEFFWLAVFGVVISGNLTGGDPLKGWLAGFLGLLLATVGQESIHAHARFAYGMPELTGGFGLIPALVGAFGFAEVLSAMCERPQPFTINRFDTVLPRLGDVLRYWRTIIRSGVIGTFIGIVPGVGEDVAAWTSYAAAKRASKEREKFGKGSVEGLMAAETGDNACVPGAVIPVLTLAVPGSAPAAVLLAAMLIHGVRPGPTIMLEAPTFVYEVVAMMLMASLGILFFGLVLTRPLVRILLVPRLYVMPVVFVFCTVGSFAIASRLFDVWTMIGFGLLGYLLRQFDYPLPPLVLGIVLGDLLDKNFRRGMVLSDGSLLPFLTRPISAVLCVTILLLVLSGIPAIRNRFGRRTAPGVPLSQDFS
jgi:putative tricarboxylic transport membrane protein